MEDMTKVMVPFMGVILIAGVLQMMLPTPEVPEQPEEPAPLIFQCPYCSATFGSMAELIAHITADHPDKPPFIEVDIGWGEA